MEAWQFEDNVVNVRQYKKRPPLWNEVEIVQFFSEQPATL